MTRIANLLAAADGPTLSFEFFPPKTDDAERAFDKALSELADLEPDFVSVTYGALGSTRERTRDLVIRIDGEQRFPAMAHLTCVGHTRDDIDVLLDAYAGSGVANILALGGDPPADGSDPGGDFAHAHRAGGAHAGPPGGVLRSAWLPIPSCTPGPRTGRATAATWPRSWPCRRLRHQPVLLHRRPLRPHGRRAGRPGLRRSRSSPASCRSSTWPACVAWPR
jgi:hypothetical protein